MDISEWQDAPRLVSTKSTADPLLSPAVIGLLGALVLHGIIVQSVYSGFSHHKNRPCEIPGQTTATTGGTGDGLVLVAVPLPKKGAQIALDESISQALSKPDMKQFLDIDMPPIQDFPLALNEEEGTNAAGSTTESSEKTRLSGIYARQIQARIERIWLRPRSPVTDHISQIQTDASEAFQCEAQIVQDATGNVQEVLLPRCNGTAAWQRSLVIAIQQASPLPAPPDTSVFSSSINLKFIAFEYGHGDVSDNYESADLHSARNSN